MNIKEFGIYLKKLRNDKKLTLHKLAELTGYSNPYISQVENGHKAKMPTPEYIKKMSDALEVDYSLLLNEAGYTDLSIANAYKDNLESDFELVGELQQQNILLKTELANLSRMEKYFSASSGITAMYSYIEDEKETAKLTHKCVPTYKGIELTHKERQFVLKTIESLIALRGDNNGKK